MRTPSLSLGALLALALAGVVAACGDADPNALRGRGPTRTSGSDPNDPAESSTTGATPNSSTPVPVPAGAGIPCDVAAVLADKCQACHGNPPTPGALVATVTIADMLAPSKTDATKTIAQVSLARMQNAASPMPPASFSKPPTPADITAFQAWIDDGYRGSCGNTGAPAPSGPLTCTSCHGDATRTTIAGADANTKSAPPRGTKGETATSTRAVGAHQGHLNVGSIANPIACAECHVVPTATNHSDGSVNVTFGTLAKTGNQTPAWNGTTCTASYCHGSFVGGATTAAPSWTGGPMTCTSCHGGPPATGDHQRGPHRIACSECHGTGYSATAVNKTLHINGVKNAGGPGSKITTWNPATRACTPTCHDTETW